MYILGQNKVVVYREPKKGWEMRYWAENGLIKCEDSRDNTVTTFISMREVLVRLNSVNEMLGRSTDQGIEVDPQERGRLMRFVEQMIELVRHAREQGNPRDLHKVQNRGKHDVPELPKQTRVLIPHNYFLD